MPTPTKSTGIGAGRAADLVYIEAAARMIAEVAEDNKIVVEKSTVPCKTAEDIRRVLAAIGKAGVKFDILSNPEFLAEGTAIKDILEPDRVLVGSLRTDEGLHAAAALAAIYGRWIPKERIITMNLWSSEMAKLSANVLLAQRISSINALSAICEEIGADVEEVSYACGLDSRIGPRMLKSSVGFGGSCYKKDVLSLVYIAETHNLPEVAAYWKGVVDINEYQKDRFIKRIVKCLFSTLTNKKVAILGYAYKKDTGDTRESAAICIVNNLIKENAEVSIYDPKVREAQIWQSLRESNDSRAVELVKSRVTICRSPYEACEGADAVVIATEWDDFSNKEPSNVPARPTAPPIESMFPVPPKKKSTGLVIRDPNTGGIINFDKSSSSPQHTAKGYYTARPASHEEPKENIHPANKTSRPSRVIPSTGLIATINNDNSPLTDISQNLNHGTPVASYGEYVGSAFPAEPHPYTPTALGAYWLGAARNGDGGKPFYPNENNINAVKQTNLSITNNGNNGHFQESTQSNGDRKRLDWAQIAKVMRRPMFVFDGRNIVDAGKLRQLGFSVEGIGKPSVSGHV